MIFIKKKIFKIYFYLIKLFFFIYPANQYFKKIYLKKFLFDQILNYVNLNSNFNLLKFYKLINKFNYIFNSINKDNYDFNLLEINQVVNIFEGDFDKWKKNQIELINFQNNISKKFNSINKTNLRYIENGYFFKTIGSHYTVDALIKSMKLGLIKKQMLFCKLPSQIHLCNKFMITKWSKYINFVDSNIDDQRFLIPHHIYIPIFNDKFFHSHSSGLKINTIWDKQKKPSLIKFNSQEIISCNSILLKMDVKKKDWFVTVHLRTSNFKGPDTYRDVNINDYKKAFQLIINAGGKIILMGSRGDKSLINFNENFIDYANSQYKSDIMDIFLCSHCKFMFGTSSGLSAISFLFKKPIALTNYLPTSTLYLRKTDLFIPRLLKYKNTNKIVPFSKQFSWPFSFGISSGHFTNIFKVNFISNSEDEIYNVAKEMLEKLKLLRVNKKITAQKEQKIFKKLSKKTLLSDEIFPLECNISNYFLKKYSKHLS